MRQHCRKIGRRIVAELKNVVLRAARLEIGNDVLAKVRREDKFVGPRGPRNAIIAWTYVDRSKSTGANVMVGRIEPQRAGPRG